MKREFSAGGIIFKKSGSKIKFLLVRNQSLKRPEVDYWGFPKGRIEEREDTKKAALREVLEETAIKAEILDKIGYSKYIFSKDGEKILKIVSFYLMKYLSGKPKNQLEEISEVGWFTKDEALKKLSFSKDKELLKKAVEVVRV